MNSMDIDAKQPDVKKPVNLTVSFPNVNLYPQIIIPNHSSTLYEKADHVAMHV